MKPTHLFLGALVLIAACALGARCYPPGTRVVIFIEGVYSQYDPAKPASDDFAKLKQAFASAGYDRAKLLVYSYTGGSFDADGTWHPTKYGCAATDRPAAQNVATLEVLLREYRTRYPNAHFTIVGHSLGGYVAFRAAITDAARPEAERFGIDTVVTLDAPLSGVDADKKIALDVLPCDKTFAAGAEIVADKLNPDIATLRATQMQSMHDAGIRVATLGSTGDCLYALNICTNSDAFVDDTETQWLAGADFIGRYPINVGDPVLSHFAVLAYPQATLDVVAFVGAP